MLLLQVLLFMQEKTVLNEKTFHLLPQKRMWDTFKEEYIYTYYSSRQKQSYSLCLFLSHPSHTHSAPRNATTSFHKSRTLATSRCQAWLSTSPQDKRCWHSFSASAFCHPHCWEPHVLPACVLAHAVTRSHCNHSSGWWVPTAGFSLCGLPSHCWQGSSFLCEHLQNLPLFQQPQSCRLLSHTKAHPKEPKATFTSSHFCLVCTRSGTIL